MVELLVEYLMLSLLWMEKNTNLQTTLAEMHFMVVSRYIMRSISKYGYFYNLSLYK